MGEGILNSLFHNGRGNFNPPPLMGGGRGRVMEDRMTENKISQYLFYALIIAVPLFFTWLTYESFYIPKRFIFQALVAVIFLYAVFITVKLPAPSPSSPPARGGEMKKSFPPLRGRGGWGSIIMAVLLFSFWGLLSLFNSINIQVSLRYYSLFLPQIGLFFLTLYLLHPNTSWKNHNPPSPPFTKGGMGGLVFIEKILNVLIIVSTISAFIGILQFFGLDYEHGIKFSIPKKLPDKTAVYSTYGNPNFMSSFLIAVIPVTLINLWYYFDDIRKRYSYSIALFILIFCILISRTKGAWLGLFVSIIVLLILIVRNKSLMPFGDLKKYLKFSVIVIAALAIVTAGITLMLPVGSNPIIAELSPITRSHLTIKGRELMWGTTFNMIKDNPIIGIGVNTFRLNYQHYQGAFLKENPEYIPYLGSAESPHNQYLEIASEQGIIGLLLFLWINIIFFKEGFRIIRSDSPLKEKAFTIGMISGASAILIHALVEFPLNLVPNAMLYWLYLGFVMVMAGGRAKPPVGANRCVRPYYGGRHAGLPLRKTFNPFLSFLIFSISAFAAVIFIWKGFGPVIASKIHKDAWYLMRDMRYKEVIPLAKKGLKWDPLNDELHLFLGVANYQLGDYKESLAEYSKAYEIYPDYMIPFNIGLIYKKSGDLRLAEEYFKRTLFLRPNLPEAYSQLSDIYKETGRIQESMEMLNNAGRYRRF